jgi:hypothetical protein
MTKEEIYVCKGCTFIGKGERSCSEITDVTKMHCGLDNFIYVEDTPESIMNYLETKLNEEEEREDD